MRFCGRLGILLLLSVSLPLVACDTGDFSWEETPPPEPPSGYWVCECAGFECLFYPELCYWVPTPTTAAGLGLLTGLVTDDGSSLLTVTAPAAGGQFTLPDGQVDVVLGGTLAMPSWERPSSGYLKVVVVNLALDTYWYADLDSAASSTDETLVAWKSLASIEGGQLAPGENPIRIVAVDGDTQYAAAKVAVVVEEGRETDARWQGLTGAGTKR